MVEVQQPATATSSKPREPFLARIRIRNYKSIEKCDVRLRPLTVLVGRNGSGKSNVLDALRFVGDSLQTSLDHAIKARGGLESVRRRSTGHPRNFAIQLDMNLPGYQVGTYGFEVAARGEGGFTVKQERLRVLSPRGDVMAEYRLEDARIIRPPRENMPPASSDRLYLVNAAGLPDFRPAYDALLSMGFYNMNPDAMRELQSPDAGELLHRDGSNIASVIARLEAHGNGLKERIHSYLEKIVPGVISVHRAQLGPKETLEFRLSVHGSAHPWRFYANSMSDGTLRALGALVGVVQLARRSETARLVGIEEPETALHPSAAGALMDALREAVAHTQVLVTSHSPDLLDQLDLDEDGLLVVQSATGKTTIAPVDDASKSAIQNHLYVPGELLRMDQLEPDREDIKRQEQLRLFEDEDIS